MKNKIKFGKYILLILCLGVMIFSLTACDSYKFEPIPGGNPNAPTESNGGQVVKQGDKLYFVNGKTDENTSNTFGDVLKGGIVRVTINPDGSLGTDYRTIVPKNVFSKGTGAGIYIFGNYIYYLTPNNEIDKNDNLLNDRLDIMRVQLDGANTVKLGTIKGLDFQYKFINGYFIYFQNNTLSIHKTDDNFTTVKTINNVTGLIMPKTEYYEKGQEYVSDYIFYTRDLTADENKDNAKNNLLYAIKCDGTNEVQIIGKDTFVPDNYEDRIENYRFRITLKDYYLDGDNITIYYTRKSVLDILSEKTYAYTFNLESLKEEEGKTYFDPSQEVLIYSNVIGSIIPYSSDSVLEISDKNIIQYKNDKKVIVSPLDEKGAGTFGGTLVQLRKESLGSDNVVMMYYTTANGFYKSVFERNGGGINIEVPTKIYDGAIGINVFGNEFIGDYFYFNNGDKYDYIYRIDVNESYTKEDLEEGSTKLNPSLVGVMNSVDLAKQKADEEEKEKNQ